MVMIFWLLLLLLVILVMNLMMMMMISLPSYMLYVLMLKGRLQMLVLLCFLLMQCQCLFKLLSCADPQDLDAVHGTHLLAAIVCVKHQQQVAHTAALRQGEGLRATLILSCEAAEQLPGTGGEAGGQVGAVLARVTSTAQHPEGVHAAAVELFHGELDRLDSAQLRTGPTRTVWWNQRCWGVRQPRGGEVLPISGAVDDSRTMLHAHRCQVQVAMCK